MNILIYTDSSTDKEGVGVASCILLTETSYIGMEVKKYKVESTSQTELLAILMALEHLDRGIYSEQVDAVLLSTDAGSLVDVYERTLETGYLPRAVKYKRVWYKILEICRRYNISIIFMASHQKEPNPNKTCDILGKVHRRCGTDMLVRG